MAFGEAFATQCRQPQKIKPFFARRHDVGSGPDNTAACDRTAMVAQPSGSGKLFRRGRFRASSKARLCLPSLPPHSTEGGSKGKRRLQANFAACSVCVPVRFTGSARGKFSPTSNHAPLRAGGPRHFHGDRAGSSIARIIRALNGDGVNSSCAASGAARP